MTIPGVDAPATGAVIDLRHVSKAFGRTRVLDGLDLRVGAGEVHGFLGPNGSGKTTTLRLLLGLLRADSGSLTVLGLDPWREPALLHRRLAYVPGDVSLWPNLSGGEVIDLFGRLRGGINPHRRDALIARFDLDPRTRGRAYSKGNRQKVALIAALATDAEVYLLDEPTSGLDPLMEAEFQQCVRELRADGRTIVLSSHILSEAEALCDRVSILRDGRIVETGSLDDLRHLTRLSVSASVEHVPNELVSLAGVHDVVTESSGGGFSTVSAQVDSSALPAVLGLLASAGARSLISRPPTLEDLFLRHYASDPRAASES